MMRLWWWGCSVVPQHPPHPICSYELVWSLLYIHLSFTQMQLWWWELFILSHIKMQLWWWGCSAVPQGQICFYELCLISSLYSFCPTLRCNSGEGNYSFFLTSRCDSDDGDVLLCLWARCVSFLKIGLLSCAPVSCISMLVWSWVFWISSILIEFSHGSVLL